MQTRLLKRTGTDWGWVCAFSCTLLLIALATLPPFVGESLRAALMQAFAGVCHQMPERSPHLGGVALAVCHRCYGMYAALAVGALAFPMLGRWYAEAGQYAVPALALAALLAALDWSLDALGVWDNTPASRLLTGAAFGLVAGFYFARALASPAQVPTAGNAAEAVSTQTEPTCGK